MHRAPELEPRRLERAASWLSLICAVHCLAMPLLGGVLSALGASHLLGIGGGLDTLLSWLVVGSVAASGTFGFLRHRDARVIGGLGLGLFCYLLGHTLEGGERGALALGFSILGALVLALSSFLGARLSHSCDHAH
jgi:hypothetical protein